MSHCLGTEPTWPALKTCYGGDLGYKVVYTIVFISMVMDDLGVHNIKTIFKKWRQKKAS